jgi:carbon monoxide dehydrogenase subunit G
MLIEGKFSVKTPIQAVWDFLLGTGTPTSCIPATEKGY